MISRGCFFIALILCFKGFAQELSLRQYTLSEEFRNLTVNAVTNDSQGLLWLGSWQGLIRFDGYDFKNFTLACDETIDNPRIDRIVKTGDDTLFIAAHEGLFQYVVGKGCIKLYNERTPVALSNKYALDLMVRKDGLWVCTWDGLNHIKNDSVEVFRPVFNPENNENVITAIIDDSKSEGMWVASGNGLYFFNPNTKIFSPVKVCGNTNAVIRKFFRDSNGRLWIASTNYGHCIYDERVKGFVSIISYFNLPSFRRNDAHDMCEDARFYWFSGDWGVYRVDKESLNAGRFTIPEHVTHSFPVLNIFLDRRENAWFGTWKSGLVQFHPAFLRLSKKKTKSFFPVKDNDIMIALEDDNNRKLIAMNSGSVFVTDSSLNLIEVKRPPISLKGEKMTFFRKAGQYFIYRAEGSMIIQNEATGEYTLLEYDPTGEKGFPSQSVRDAILDDKGAIWIGTNKGLCRYDPIKKECKTYFHSTHDSSSISGHQVRQLAMHNGQLYVLTLDGVSRYSYSEDAFYVVVNPGVYCNFHNFLIEKDKIWITSDSGLLCAKHTSGMIKRYDNRQGLLYDDINGITKDDKGHLWVINDKFLSYFDREEEQFTNYLLSDRMSGITLRKYLLAGNGESHFWFTDGTDLILFDTGPEKYLPESSHVVCTTLTINGTDRTEEFYSYLHGDTRDLVLDYEQNNLAIGFSGLNFLFQQNNRYSYKLEGFDSKWNFPLRERKAVYTNLPPGDYLFRVKFIDNNGQEVVSDGFHFVIASPFWQKVWFKAAMMGMCCILIWGFITLRTKNVRRKNIELEKVITKRTAEIEKQKEQISVQKEDITKKAEELRRLNATKDKFFSLIAHDLKNPFFVIDNFSKNLISNFRQLSEGEKMQIAEGINRSSRGAYGLLENLLLWARSQSGNIQVKLEEFNVRDVVFEVCEILNPLIDKKEISLSYEVPERMALKADKNMISTAIRNLLSNAIKYTSPGGDVAIRAERAGAGMIHIRVSDNGIGIDEEKVQALFNLEANSVLGTAGETGTGLGLIITREFVEKNGGAIWIESERNRGSTFTFSVPEAGHEIPTSTRERSVDSKAIQQHLEEEQRIKSEMESMSTPDEEAPLILVVDDQPELRAAIKLALQASYKVVEASDGLTGFSVAKEIIPDLIISDIVMPKLDGVELSRRLKDEERTSHIPVILLSAKDALAEKVRGLEAGADDYMTKPFRHEELSARVASQITNRKKLKQLFIKWADHPEKNHIGDKFLEKLIGLIEQHIDDAEYNIDQFSSDCGMSQAQLYRKIKAITGFTPFEFIKYTRLKKASRMLQDKDVRVNEIAYKVGFKDPSHFAKSFRKQFGKSPSDYQKSNSY